MGGRFGIWWRITMPKRTNKFFAGTPNGFFKNFFPKRNPKKFAGFRNSNLFFKNFFPKRNSTIFFRTAHKNFPKFASKFGNKLVTKRVAKDIDPTRIKRIKPTNKYKIRLFLEKNNYFHRKIIRVSSASSPQKELS